MADNTKALGPFYATTLRYDRSLPSPLALVTFSNEIEAPFRRGRGFGLRWRRGAYLVLGYWKAPSGPENEAQGLLVALQGYEVDVDTATIREW